MPRAVFKQSLTERSTNNVANASASRQHTKDNTGIRVRVLLLDFANDCRPRRSERASKQTIEDAEDVERRKADREAPDQKDGDRAADGRTQDAGSGVISIDHRAHDHTAKNGGEVEEHDCQGSFDIACAQAASVGGQIDGWKEVAHRLEDVAGLVDEECRVREELEIQRPGPRCAGNWETRSDEVQQWPAQDDKDHRPGAQGCLMAVGIQHPLQDDGKNDARQASSSLTG